jgi:hypothetical protein
MQRQILLDLTVAATLAAVQLLQAQTKPDGGMELDVRNVRAIPQVYVALQLRASAPLFVPYCAEFEGGDKVLCTMATHLEVHTAQGWHRAKLRTTFAVLGGLSLDRAKGDMVPAGTRVTFSYQFSRRYFEVEPGQQLRVVVEAWPDEQSMKTGGKSIEVVSTPFKCPPTGTGE